MLVRLIRVVPCKLPDRPLANSISLYCYFFIFFLLNVSCSVICARRVQFKGTVQQGFSGHVFSFVSLSTSENLVKIPSKGINDFSAFLFMNAQYTVDLVTKNHAQLIRIHCGWTSIKSSNFLIISKGRVSTLISTWTGIKTHEFREHSYSRRSIKKKKKKTKKNGKRMK